MWNSLGQWVAGAGGIVSNLVGRDVRLGGGQGLGAKIAGQSQPYYSTNQNLAYAKSQAGVPQTNPYSQWGASSNTAGTQMQYQTPGGTPIADPNKYKGYNVGDVVGNVRVVDPGKGIVETLGGQLSGPSPEELYAQQVRGEIEGGYNSYFSELDNIMNTSLPAQRTAQEGIATSQGVQAETTLGAQKTQGLADLGTQRRQTEQGQAKNLQGLAEDVRNLFKAGSIKLGAMGAGDSSAANQYSYAISKMGNQNRGNIMQQATEINNQINDREFKLKSTYDSELNNIKEQVNQKSMEIANWFSQAQQQLQMAKAQGQLQKGQDLASLSKQLLSQVQNALMMIQQEASNRMTMLQTWAANNSTTIQQLKSNMAAIPGVAQQISAQPLQGQLTSDGTGGLAFNRAAAGYGYSGTTEKKYDIYGREIA